MSTSAQKDSSPAFLTRYPILESLQYRDFRWMWLGSLGSFMAMNMQMITRGWLVLRLADDSPLALALVMMSFSLPMTFVSLIGGALADRISRKRIVILSQIGNLLLTALLATLDITGVIAFWQLLVIGFVNGSLVAINMPSRQAIISDIVPERSLMNAISLSNSAMNATRIVGPAIAGLLIILIDTAGVFYLISGLYVFAVISIAMINAGKEPARRSRKSIIGDIREGLAYVISAPTLLGLVFLSLIASIFGFSYFALLPAWAREALDVEADALGYLLMIMGIGALVGTLALAALPKIKRRGILLLVACLGWGIGLAVFSQASSFMVAVPLLLLTGLSSSVFMSLNMTMMQLYSSPEMRGRVMSISMMTFGVMPLGAVPLGALAEYIGTPTALLLSGGLLIGVTLLFSVFYPSFRRVD
ncbi:MAG: MFS transporter [Chloroflexi bacterium]|nr:MFS transporter [Chloroflexota bacterium]